MPESMLTQETFERDNLIAGDFPLVTESGTIEDGEIALTRGAVLGKVTASGEYKLSDIGAGDGSETPTAILGRDTDASLEAVAAPIYLTGEFTESQLTLGAAHTLASIKDGLRVLSIFLKSSVEK